MLEKGGLIRKEYRPVLEKHDFSSYRFGKKFIVVYFYNQPWTDLGLVKHTKCNNNPYDTSSSCGNWREFKFLDIEDS